MGTLMKKAALIAVCAFLVVGGGTIVAAKIHRQQKWKQAFRAALDSGERAFDYRDTEIPLSEPRLNAFETTYNALRRLDPPDELDSSKTTAMGKCLDDLKLYRTNHQNQINDSLGLSKTVENCLNELEL